MSVEGSEIMMMASGWFLFLLTLVIAVWRDIAGQEMGWKRADEDLEFLRNKQAEWQAEKQAMQDRIVVLANDKNWLLTRLENARRSLSGYTK